MPKENEVINMEDLDKLIAASLEKSVAAAVAAALKELRPGIGDAEDVFDRNSGITRGRKFQLGEDKKGIAAARLVRCLAFAKGDVAKAAWFAKKAFNDDLGDEIHRALTAGDMSAAGSLIPPAYAAEIIELLRSATVVRRAQARVVPLDNGTLTIRKQTAGSTASYVGESENIGVTIPETGLLVLSAKKLAAIVPISNELLKWTAGPSADEFVRDDLVAEISVREDRAFIRDDGTDHTPKGMRYWAAASNVTASNGNTSANIEEDFRNLIDGLEDNDVKLLRPAWFMHPSRKNYLRNLRDPNGNLIYPEVRQANPTLYGYPLFPTTSIPKNLGVGGNESEVYFADMADALIGEAQGIEIAVDSSAAYLEGGVVKSAFSRDETLIRAIEMHDFALRHNVSVSIKTGVTWGA
jgi:HK97 family phage major capsid protein